MASNSQNAHPIINKLDVFDELRDIWHPEQLLSLEDLRVITEDAIEVDDRRNTIRISFTPTDEHCTSVALIGLCLRVKLAQFLPSNVKVEINVASGSHEIESEVNKQLNDKEKIAAALEKPAILRIVDECLAEYDD